MKTLREVLNMFTDNQILYFNDCSINDYDYFKGMIFKTVDDNDPITFEFRGHSTSFIHLVIFCKIY